MYLIETDKEVIVNFVSEFSIELFGYKFLKYARLYLGFFLFVRNTPSSCLTLSTLEVYIYILNILFNLLDNTLNTVNVTTFKSTQNCRNPPRQSCLNPK